MSWSSVMSRASACSSHVAGDCLEDPQVVFEVYAVPLVIEGLPRAPLGLGVGSCSLMSGECWIAAADDLLVEQIENVVGANPESCERPVISLGDPDDLRECFELLGR